MIKDSGPVVLIPPSQIKQSDYDHVIAYQEESRDCSKTGPQPKKLVAMEVYGYEVGRGLNKRLVTPQEVFKLAAMGCTDREIATWFDVKEDTLRYNFADIMAKGRQEAKNLLRAAMLKNALNGNAALQIFLAKNWLGMSDQPQNSEDRQPLPWSDDL